MVAVTSLCLRQHNDGDSKKLCGGYRMPAALAAGDSHGQQNEKESGRICLMSIESIYVIALTID